MAGLASSPEWAAEAESYLGTALHLASWHQKPLRATELRRQAREQFKRALEINPRLLLAMNNIALLSLQEGLENLNHGVDPTLPLSLALTQYRKLQAEFPEPPVVPLNLAAAVWALASWDLWQGEDPRPRLEEGQQALETLLAHNPRSAIARNNLASLLHVAALWQQWTGQDAQPTLARAWDALAAPEVVEADPNASITRLRIAVARLREALLNAQPTAEAALEVTQQLPQTLRQWPEAWDALGAAAEGELLLALAGTTRTARALIVGFQYLEKAAQIYPRQPDLCRLHIAYAAALPPSSPMKSKASSRTNTCLEHWGKGTILEVLARLADSRPPAPEPNHWPGLSREAALWKLSQGP